MKTSGNNIFWSPGEVIYKIDSEPNGIFIIMSGSVSIYSKDGLRLNTLKEKEVFDTQKGIVRKISVEKLKDEKIKINNSNIETEKFTTKDKKTTNLKAVKEIKFKPKISLDEGLD